MAYIGNSMNTYTEDELYDILKRQAQMWRDTDLKATGYNEDCIHGAIDALRILADNLYRPGVSAYLKGIYEHF